MTALTRCLSSFALLSIAVCVAMGGDEEARPAGVTSGTDSDPPSAVTTSEGCVPLNLQETVFLDLPNRRLLLKTKVVLRDGVLEMFLCKEGTKEHESIVAIDSEAYVIHAGLLALGAHAGRSVRFEPSYAPPEGQRIDVFVAWTDPEGGRHRQRAQEWVRHVTRRYYVEPLGQLPAGLQVPEGSELRFDERRHEIIWFGPMSAAQRDEHLALSGAEDYQRAIRAFFERSQMQGMDAEFVFTGSGFHVSEDGTRHYLAESGNIICVANFSDAMIDVAIQSSSDNDGLLFEPFTERIPPLGAEVTVELVPRFDKAPAPTDGTTR